MSVIHSITHDYAAFSLARAKPNTSTLHEAARFRAGVDSAEFSGASRALARAVEESSLRLARVRAIRTAISDGTYETFERIQGTVSYLLNVLA